MTMEEVFTVGKLEGDVRAKYQCVDCKLFFEYPLLSDKCDGCWLETEVNLDNFIGSDEDRRLRPSRYNSSSNFVTPLTASGYNVSWNLNLFSGPKWDITCGKCGHTFTQRIPVRNNPEVVCPACHTVNVINLRVHTF